MIEEIAITSATYDQMAADSAARWGALDIPALAEARRRFVSHLRPGALVLDVGCGPGRDTVRLSEWALCVCGIDRSMGMLRQARRAHHRPLMLGDMAHLPLRARLFDGLWVCASFLHIPKRDGLTVLSEFRRVLRPDGLLYLSVKEGDGEGWVADEAGMQRFFAFYREPELDALLAAAGFTLCDGWVDDDSSGRPQQWLTRLTIAG